MITRLFYLLLLPLLLFSAKPELLLLKTYDENLSVNGWLMSEKLDGIRAYWDGEKLISRNGNVFHTPAWFTKDFPPFEIDGELWSKRGDFEHISSITSQEKPHNGWRDITYNIFEVPNQKGGLLQRLNVLQGYLQKYPNKYINIIKQTTCKDKAHLKSFLKEVESEGGEGVVLRNPQALYIAKRTNEALKVKSFQDSECEVIAHNEGKGKYIGLLGSLTCKKDDIVFKIGSGLNDELRRNPPNIGTMITYKYQGLTKSGKPRFSVFLRIRKER